MLSKYLYDDNVVLKHKSVDEKGASRYRRLEQNVPDGYVTDLQNDLNALGYTEAGTPDGSFGENTKKAVRSLQDDEFIVDDGIVDFITKDAIKTRLQESEGFSREVTDTSKISWNEFPENASPKDKVSKNFQLFELTKSGIAIRQGIQNDFTSSEELHCAVFLCRNVLQPVRDRFGRFSPNSIYRSQALERALKKKPDSWVSKSQHTKGQACDIEVFNATNMQLAKWVKNNLEFDQLILECYSVSAGPNSGWVHVSILPPGIGANRKKVLSYVKNQSTGKYQYVNGLVEQP